VPEDGEILSDAPGTLAGAKRGSLDFTQGNTWDRTTTSAEFKNLHSTSLAALAGSLVFRNLTVQVTAGGDALYLIFAAIGAAPADTVTTNTARVQAGETRTFDLSGENVTAFSMHGGAANATGNFVANFHVGS